MTFRNASLMVLSLVVLFFLGIGSAVAADYLEANEYINYNDPQLRALSNSLVTDDMGDREKMEAIYAWVTSNVAYDYDAYVRQEAQLVPASKVLGDKVGLCRDYAFLFAALARSAGLPTKVVYGDATSGKSKIYHAWNEVLVDGEWIAIDSCWDAGYVNKSGFVQRPTTKFFGTNTMMTSHVITKVTAY